MFDKARTRYPQSVLIGAIIGVICLVSLVTSNVHANVRFPSLYDLALIKVAEQDSDVLDFYKARAFEPLWLGNTPEAHRRLTALYTALVASPTHGIPQKSVNLDQLSTLSIDYTNPDGWADAEIEISKIYLNYAQTVSFGVLEPKEVSELISVKKIKPYPTKYLLNGIASENPEKFLAELPPQTLNYRNLRKALINVHETIVEGGWGQVVSASVILPGETGSQVVVLRNRLIRMGYLPRTTSPIYDLSMERAVRLFQRDHGMHMDGIAGEKTIAALNVSPEERIQQVLAALERSRWFNRSLGQRHILVNIPEYRARVYDNGRSVFETNIVVGQAKEELQTPEFSDVMEYIIVNPVWNLPQSIVHEEIIPEIIEDATAQSEIQFLDNENITVDREMIDFSAFPDGTGFPFHAKQMPGPTNPLGMVKFMFPNQHNVYLHDSPFRELFDLELRAYSHGCVRVKRAHELARSILHRQGDDFDYLIDSANGTLDEVEVKLQNRVPVHITYRTAWVQDDNKLNFRPDIYGRDKLVFDALVESGLNIVDLVS